MFFLNHSLGKEGTCRHRFPDIEFIADMLDRQEKEIRIYFCNQCKDYRWKYPETETLNEGGKSDLARDSYFFYCNQEDLTEMGKRRKIK